MCANSAGTDLIIHLKYKYYHTKYQVDNIVTIGIHFYVANTLIYWLDDNAYYMCEMVSTEWEELVPVSFRTQNIEYRKSAVYNGVMECIFIN